MDILLPDLAATRSFGRCLAGLLAGNAPDLSADRVPVFFYGDVGMGKTTCISALVAALPGGDQAETGSPSFTVCNIYPTSPPVAHYDMYRQENGLVDESFLDFLEEGRHVVLIEWAERLPDWMLPPDRLSCQFLAHVPGRLARLQAVGRGSVLLERLEEVWFSDAARPRLS